MAVPWNVLETRAFTETAANDGSNIQRPILQRLFGRGCLDTLGVRMDTVPVGRSEWPLITGGALPGLAKEAASAGAAVTAAFTTAALRPKRLSGVFEYTHEIAGQCCRHRIGFEARLGRRGEVEMSDIIINGTAPADATPQNIEGFLSEIPLRMMRRQRRFLAITLGLTRRGSMASTRK